MKLTQVLIRLRRANVILLFATPLLLAGMFGPKLMKFDARTNEGQQVFFIRGAPVILADGGSVRVMMGPDDPAPEKNQRINFYIRVHNFTNAPLTIRGDQIRAVREDGKEIRVWTATEVRKDIAKRADRARFAAALAQTLGNMSAQYANVPGQEARSAQQRAEAYASSRDAMRRADDREAFERSMVGIFLERETILPGQYYFGMVQIDPPDRKGKATTFKFLTIFGDDPIPIEFFYGPAE